ncbi:MAG TPA: nuclear transport factor 2 family protein [Chitinophaga sp.]|uniref:nuclear transport factor 2 family protein n=1 Tax=Chitinophaga sp. TaxID=1869181 RepID=UPI002DBCB8CF|nr:nuclear transport factor 2 family protein [Chitinophaga sp.]HEU4556150.1 nuclear transport factor 2 family protein [Chitinophaga sp.]
MTNKLIFILSAMLIPFAAAFGQNDTPADAKEAALYQEIYTQDSVFFSAFNKCDTATYRQYLTNDFEFYHDQGGLHYLDKEMQSMREMCRRNSHIRRELLKNTLEVHRLGSFGALEIGVHRFYHTNPGESEHVSGTYKFIHVWQKKGNAWRLSRVISYDHGKMNNN